MTHLVADSRKEEIDVEGDSAGSRRSFLQTALAAGPLAALMAAGATTARGQEPSNPPKINIPNLYPGWNAKNFSEIRKNENAHFQFLTQTLGSNALTLPPLNIQNLTLNAQSPIYFAAYASIFENTGTGTYLSAAPLLYDKNYLAAAGTILVVEANHSGYLNSLINYPIVNNNVSFAQPFPLQVTLNNIQPYFTDFTPVLQLASNISTTPSAANDITILNFARVLEFLEAVFYNINVPIFFNV